MKLDACIRAWAHVDATAGCGFGECIVTSFGLSTMDRRLKVKYESPSSSRPPLTFVEGVKRTSKSDVNVWRASSSPEEYTSVDEGRSSSGINRKEWVELLDEKTVFGNGSLWMDPVGERGDGPEDVAFALVRRALLRGLS